MKQYVIILFFALLLRVLWVFFIAPIFPNALGDASWVLNPGFDSWALTNIVSPDFNQVYDPGARGILSGAGFTDSDGNLTAYVGPGYSFFVAILYMLFGINLVPLRIVQVVMDVGTCLIVGLIGKKIASPKVAKLSMLIYAFYPLAFYQSGLLISETLCTFLTAIFFFLALNTETNNKNKYLSYYVRSLFLAGFFLGLASLVRPNLLPLVLSFFIFLIYKRDKIFRGGFSFILGVTLVVLPWIIRNYILFDQFIPISSIVFGAIDDVDRNIQLSFIEVIFNKITSIFSTEANFINNLGRFFTIWYTTSSGFLDSYLIFIQFPFVLLVVMGFMVSFKGNRLNTIFGTSSLLIFIAVLVFIAKNALARYTVPILPIIIPFAAIALNEITKRLMKFEGK